VKILVLNTGSSSIKYQLREVAGGAVAAGAAAAGLGLAGEILADGEVDRIAEEGSVPGHGRALELILESLLDPTSGVVKDTAAVSAVGHRVVHGGERFTAPALITVEVIAQIEECSSLAPLHNPPALAGIREAQRILPHTPQVAVFDTAFHATMPQKARVYALPYRYTEAGVRRYGFHGISYSSVTQRLDGMLSGGLAGHKVMIAHLGNGASICAVDGGVCVDTSMGLTPLEGLVMGTRSGDVDPGAVLYLIREFGLTADDLDRILNKESGILGVSGVSNDMRDVLGRADSGDERCRLAIDVYVHRLRKYVGAFAASMGGLDTLVFTAGVGENSGQIRAAVCEGLGFLGVALDPEANDATHGVEKDISAAGARVRVLVVPTDEEGFIARATAEVVGAG
jgi:acetate kinase